MKAYQFRYLCDNRFSRSVSWHFFHLRALPVENECQKLQDLSFSLSPLEHLQESVDSFGNRIQYGSIIEAHDCFTYESGGTVKLSPYLIPEAEAPGIYKVTSALTEFQPVFDEWADKVPYSNDFLLQAVELSTLVFNGMTYSPHTTGNGTTALQAFTQRQGVCQDYAHILLVLCRHRGIPCRYVNGFIPGEGETHAWVEVWHKGAWHGIDPTHNRLIDWGYIKLSHGRDAADCPVNRGIFRGFASQQSIVKVEMKEI